MDSSSVLKKRSRSPARDSELEIHSDLIDDNFPEPVSKKRKLSSDDIPINEPDIEMNLPNIHETPMHSRCQDLPTPPPLNNDTNNNNNNSEYESYSNQLIKQSQIKENNNNETPPTPTHSTFININNTNNNNEGSLTGRWVVYYTWDSIGDMDMTNARYEMDLVLHSNGSVSGNCVENSGPSSWTFIIAGELKKKTLKYTMIGENDEMFGILSWDGNNILKNGKWYQDKLYLKKGGQLLAVKKGFNIPNSLIPKQKSISVKKKTKKKKQKQILMNYQHQHHHHH